MMQPDLITASLGPQPVRLRFSVDDYYKMYELGLLRDFEKSEIIDGELIKKMSIGDKHAWVVDFLNRFFILRLPETFRVRIQNPLRLNDFTEPEPDIVLTDLTKYDGKRHPRPAETILAIEVSDTTVRYDRGIKLPLYASAEIPEVWIINLPDNLVEVYQNPEFGLYQTTTLFRFGDIITSQQLPDISLNVSELLG